MPPEGKILVPGVIAHTTNTVEHPELAAWRFMNFAAGRAGERHCRHGLTYGNLGMVAEERDSLPEFGNQQRCYPIP